MASTSTQLVHSRMLVLALLYPQEMQPAEHFLIALSEVCSFITCAF